MLNSIYNIRQCCPVVFYLSMKWDGCQQVILYLTRWFRLDKHFYTENKDLCVKSTFFTVCIWMQRQKFNWSWTVKPDLSLITQTENRLTKTMLKPKKKIKNQYQKNIILPMIAIAAASLSLSRSSSSPQLQDNRTTSFQVALERGQQGPGLLVLFSLRLLWWYALAEKP